MKKTLYASIAATILAFGGASISHAQNFLAPIQAKIGQLQQERNAAEAKYFNQENSLQAPASSSFQSNPDKTGFEKKIAKPLDENRTEIADEFQNALLILQNLMDRINSRMAKMQTAGIDTASSSAIASTTDSDIASVSANLANLEQFLAEPTATSTHEIILTDIRNESDITKTSVQTAYASLMNLIGALKQESENQSVSASNTESTSTDDSADAGAATTSQE